MKSGETVEGLVQKLEFSIDPADQAELVSNLRTVLGQYSRAELADKIASNERLLEVLFGCLSTNPEHEDLAENACGILNQLMDISEPGEILRKYHTHMLEVLDGHPLPEVRYLVLSQLEKCLQVDTATESLCTNHPELILAAIRQQVFTDDLSVSNKSGIFLVKLAEMPSGQTFLGGQSSLDQFQSLIDTAIPRSPERYLLYETLANMSIVCSELYEDINTKTMLTRTLSDLAFLDADLLGAANALEILSTLAGTPFGLEGVKRAGVIERMEALFVDRSARATTLLPETLKFIRRVAEHQLPPPIIRDIVLDSVIRADLEIPMTTVSIEAMSFIGCSKEGKQYLFGKPQSIQCFERARQIIENAPMFYRIRVVDAMTILFSTEDNDNRSQCLPHWFNILFPQIPTLFGLVQQPFPDIRLSSLNFLTVIAHLDWAQRHYLQTPGIVNFLTDRSIEPDKECLFAKYKIVEIIVGSSSAERILSAEDFAKLKIYKEQGPYYVSAEAAVATDRAS